MLLVFVIQFHKLDCPAHFSRANLGILASVVGLHPDVCLCAEGRGVFPKSLQTVPAKKTQES